MRVLFLDANLLYVNPTRNLLPSLLRRLGDLTFFGPGYTGEDVLRLGLKHFVKRNGPFDVVVATEHITRAALISSIEQTYPIYRRNYVSRISIEELGYLGAIHEAFDSLGGIKVITLLETDYYNMAQTHVHELETSGAYVVGWGSEFLMPAKVTESVEESFSLRAGDQWLDFVRRRPDRIISLPHFVDETEVGGTQLQSRPSAWSVVGSNYAAREHVRTNLSNANIKWRGKGLNQVQAGLTKLRLNAYNKKFGIQLLNHFFRRAIAGSRYSYTCGSSLRYPIRKFFEIPALGSVLVCQPCAGFEALGFRDGENAIACEPDEIIEMHSALEGDPDRAQDIASAGRALVQQRHSLEARARQLGRCLDAIATHSFGGTRWENGDLRVLPANSSAIA